MKLYERLGLSREAVNVAGSLESLELQLKNRTESDYEAAWRKYNRPARYSLVALKYYLQEQPELARQYATGVLETSEEFFFGEWRQTFTTPKKKADPTWWKERFGWIEIFEACLLWASALGEWNYLHRLGSFPEPNGCISLGWKAQDRDLNVAIGAFLRNAPCEELDPLLNKVASGSKKTCKCLVELIRACVARDQPIIETTLTKYLKLYRKADFPQIDIFKTISIFGTLFVHWAAANGLEVSVPAEFEDHIVRLRKRN